MTDPKEGLHIDKDGNKFLVVATAKHAPRWYAYLGYLGLFCFTYMADPSGDNWWIFLISGLAMVLVYGVDHLYSAVVSIYNEMRVGSAIDGIKQTLQPKVPALTEEETTILGMYHDTLEYIQSQSKELGDARDAAWRALTHKARKDKMEEDTDGKET